MRAQHERARVSPASQTLQASAVGLLAVRVEVVLPARVRALDRVMEHVARNHGGLTAGFDLDADVTRGMPRGRNQAELVSIINDWVGQRVGTRQEG